MLFNIFRRKKAEPAPVQVAEPVEAAQATLSLTAPPEPARSRAPQYNFRPDADVLAIIDAVPRRMRNKYINHALRMTIQPTPQSTEWVDVRTAAKAAGLSIMGMYGRIHRGAVVAKKDDKLGVLIDAASLRPRYARANGAASH
jgi:hypothetical protein